MTKILNFDLIPSYSIGSTLHLVGFVHRIRDHGSLIFVDLRNETSFVQCVIDPIRNSGDFATAQELHNEYVVEIEGTLVRRSDDRINPDIANGELEVEIEKLTIVATAKTLPYDLHNDESMAGEDIRLKYRYLDLRREKMHKMLQIRHRLILNTRVWFDKEGFIEVQTPILANSSPEGARDYLVPSRVHPGKFYALPQAPQQFKQLLMVGGFNKYFQIAPCFRDEDPRADRSQGDFYQIDLEMAWSRPDDVYKMWEKYCNEVLTNPHLTTKKLLDTDGFTRLTYDNAMDWYGSDKPDLRFELKWIDVKPYFKGCGFSVFAQLAEESSSRVQALVLKGMVEKFSRAQLDKLQDIGRDHGLPGIAYIQYTKEEAKSPLFKFLSEEDRKKLESGLNLETGDLVLFLAHENKSIVHKAQHEMRVHIARKEGLIDENVLKFVWITDFPFFEKDDKTGKIDFAHNPFSMWQSDVGITALQTLAKYSSEDRLLELKAYQYDITCNGYEISSGGLRNNIPEGILEAFKIVGYTEEEVRSRFSHMLEAYEFGAPYHAGFAPGVERLIMILTGETNIREVIPFPKNGSGIDVMTNSPSFVSPKQLSELSLKLEI